MNGHRERVAWFILLGSLFICVGLAVVVPLGISTYIQQSTRDLDVNVQANQGTVGILQTGNETGAIFAGDPAQELNEGGTILTNDRDTALILVTAPESGDPIARIQVYGNSNIQLNQALTPRFQASKSSDNLILTLKAGRMLINIPGSTNRDLSFRLEVPEGVIGFADEGQYSITTISGETLVSVMGGQVEISQDGTSLSLLEDQRAVLRPGAPIQGPLDTERNLIVNGDFSDGFEEWLTLASNIELAAQPDVDTFIEEISDETAVSFRRTGIGHADSGLRQIVDQDVTDFQTLRLLISMVIANQSLGVCGQQGSECPLIVRIEYVDSNGIAQVWQQGFYANGNISPDTPDVCIACPPPLNGHQQVPFQQLVFYESDNLLEQLDQIGILPRHIKSVTLISSGHTFETSILELALMAQE